MIVIIKKLNLKQIREKKNKDIQTCKFKIQMKFNKLKILTQFIHSISILKG